MIPDWPAALQPLRAGPAFPFEKTIDVTRSPTSSAL
jgi:hypothetical protein